ncbi:hypothetical protein [Novosphingobium sp. Fuku2-ISO-50]|uniref:hypothetical protein n=1 Tax=Novosphingobium sp. Fuku2-ISO-50 TaxID=1739114 RepID=UPI00076DCCA5|nr:hypothetical protein [Novosphingobium sp. Fuku2-ISO-50]KUR75339.1 hypothetical protein AQZ50_15900 [Novosphingobium sp. Fuku2-ISO-50]
MIGRLFNQARDRLVARLPAPMAAPETVAQRRRRWRLICLLAMMAMVSLMAPTLAGVSQAGTALLWLGLALATLLQGTTWLTAKLHADAVWFDERPKDPSHEIGEP